MNNLEAYKMDGLGNDFIIFDNRKSSISLTKDQIIKIADRNNIGCDQVIFIDKDKSYDASLKFFNSDGNEISACGNGSRCVAYLLMQENKSKKTSLRTKSRVLYAQFSNNNMVNINMGQPYFEWNKIPLLKSMDNKNLQIVINDNNENEIRGGFSLSVGNPHIIFFVEDVENFDLKKIGPEIENHKLFPEKCNVTLAKVINKNLIKVKVWERGAGLTKACGTAACATAIAGNINGLVEKKTDIEFKLGKLSIFIDDKNIVHMNGPVSDIKNIEIKI